MQTKNYMYPDFPKVLRQSNTDFVNLHGWTGGFVPFNMTNDLMLPVTAKGISCPDN